MSHRNSQFISRVIPADGQLSEVGISPMNGTDFDLLELQKICGGYIQVITLTDGNYMVLNEEGKIHGLPVNIRATNLAKNSLGGGDFIVGNVAVIRPNEFR